MKTQREISLDMKAKAAYKFLVQKVSQVQIAKEMGVSQTAVSRWVKNVQKEEFTDMLQSSDTKKQLKTRKNLPKKKKTVAQKKSRKSNAPVRFGYEEEKVEEAQQFGEVNEEFDSFSYSDPLKKTASEISIKTLHEHGFFVWPGKFSDADLSEVFLYVSRKAKNSWRYIFNPNKKRMQCKDFKSFSFKCVDEAIRFLKTINKELEPRQLVALKTEEDAKKQFCHTDYNPEMIFDLPDHHMPLLLMIPLEDNTTLHIWNPSRAILAGTYRFTKVKSSVLTINKGDLVVFRGDLIHAGSEWNGSAKYRLHCYFHHPSVPFPDNQTWRVNKNRNSPFGHVADVIDEDNETEEDEI